MSAVLVLNPSQDALQNKLSISMDEINNQSTSVFKKTLVIGQSFVEIAYLQGPVAASTGKFLYVTFNASSDNAALTKLGIAGLRFPIPLGEVRRFTFPPTSLCTRIDFVTDQAETGTSKIIVTTGI